MSLNRFVNYDNISLSKTLTMGRVLPDNIIKSISFNEGLISNFSVEDCTFDIHLYNETGDYLKSLYNQNIVFDSEYNDFYYNVSKAFFNSNINSGLVKACLNFSLDLFGNVLTKYLVLKEVSPDNTELKFELNKSYIQENPNILNQFKEFDSLISVLKSFGRVNNLIVNYGSNLKQPIVNIKTDCSEDYVVYVKLLNSIISDIDINDLAYISFKVCEDYIDSFLISPVEVELRPNELRGPNFDIPFGQEGGDSTSFKSWDNLLSIGEETTNDLLLKTISGSESIPLNIDYRNFGNFVFYGSAEERLKNYDYKRRLIEYYNTQIISSSVSSSFYGNVNNINNTNKINNLKSTFDPFEKWLHEESGSLFTHDVTGSVEPAPKYISSSKYVLYSTTSSEYSTWYSRSLSMASDYDRENLNRLYEYTPGHIVNDSNNSEYVLFLDMIGQHFDNIYSYVKELTSIHEKDEHPSRGIPNELLKDYAESLGWDVKNGYQLSDLWLYKLGQNSSGSFDDLDSLPSQAHENLSFQIWRRVVNNLPLLLKTKGTSRSIKSLMSSYGIPKTLISIKEYGGPSSDDFDSLREDNVYNYYLDFTGSQYIEMPLYPVDNTGSSTFEFRFKTNYSSSVSMSLFSIEDQDNRNDVLHNLELVSYLSESTSSYSGSYLYGKIRYTGTYDSGSVLYTSSVESGYIPIFDNDFWDVQVKTLETLSDTVESSSIEINIQKTSDYTYNRISFSESMQWVPGGSINYTFGASTSLTSSGHYIMLGGSTGSVYNSRFVGGIQFYREYNVGVSKSIFDDHTLNPQSYTSNDYSSSFEDLVRYFPLGGDVIRYDHSITSSITSSHPDRDSITPHSYATLYNFTGSQSNQYLSNSEVYYTKIPSTGANIVKSNKVRIEDNNSGQGVTLHPDKRVEESAYDNSSKDTNRLVVAYSPTDQVNKDIYNQYGYFNLDNILGDPKDQEKPKYNGLESFRNSYWKKYSIKNNYNKYIEIFSLFNFSFFDQVKQLVPARSNLISGILVENTILERPRVERKNPSISYNNLSDSINARTDKQIGRYTYITSSLDYDKVIEIEEKEYTSSIDYSKDISIQHKLEDTYINISKSVGINQVDYTSSIYNLLSFSDTGSKVFSHDSRYKYFGTISDTVVVEDYISYSSSKVIKDSYSYNPEILLGNSIALGESIFPDSQQNTSSVSLDIYDVNSDSISHNNSGSIGDSIDNTSFYSSSGYFVSVKSGSSINTRSTIQSSRVGVEYVERERIYTIKKDGVLTEYTRIFNETDKYDINLTSYQDTPYLYFNNNERVGYVNGFNYDDFYSGNYTGSYELTSSLMGIQTMITSSLLRDFINRYGYHIDSSGTVYRIKNNGSKQISITGSRLSSNYKKEVYFYSSSKEYNDRFIYNYVDVAVSMSKGDYYSSSLEPVNYQYDYDSVYNRVRYEGSRLEGPDINVATTNTIDGGPVVVIKEVDSNNLTV